MSVTRSLNNSMIPMRLPFLLVMFSMIGQAKSYSQYNLPKAEVLVKNKVRAIHITRVPTRMENARKRNISTKSFDRTAQKLTTYFIDSNGRIDSVYQYYRDNLRFKKHLFSFDKDNKLTEINSIDHEGVIVKRRLIEKTAQNEFHYQQWNHGTLMHELKITSDSIIYENTIYQSFTPSVYYTKTAYNLEENIKTETAYEDGEVIKIETYQWFANMGVPYRFVYTKYTSGEGKEEAKNETSEFKVSEDGSVNSKNKGMFTDPFNGYNYFDRQIHYSGIQHPFSKLLRASNLVSKWEKSEIVGFDGTQMVYTYQATYEKF